MSPEETKELLTSVINNLITDNSEDAQKGIHDVLSAKMRARINPAPAAGDEPAPTDEPTETETVVDETPPTETDETTD